MSAAIGPILLLGARGMLGRAWSQLLDDRGILFTPLGHEALDVTDLSAIERCITADYPVVVNCAAWTDVDAAETNEDQVTRLNGAAVALLASRCGDLGTKLVHYSTDYVFNGRRDKPYRVDDPIDPVGAYGRSKAHGEQALVASGCNHLLVRTSWLYAPWGRNFVRTIAKLAREKEQLRVVNDQRGRPTSCEHLAGTTLALLERGATNIYHVTDGGECTWCRFAREIAGYVNPNCRVEPCTTAEFPRPAKRPPYSVLDLHETEQLLGPMPCWQDNLADVVKRLEP